MDAKSPTTIWILLLAGCLSCAAGPRAVAAAPSPGDVLVRNGVAIYVVPRQASQQRQQAAVDYRNSRPMALPRTHGSTAPSFRDGMVEALLTPESGGTPRLFPGSEGDGTRNAAFLGHPRRSEPSQQLDRESDRQSERQSDFEVAPQQNGTLNHPFTTARADAYEGTTNTQYPYRASGKLFFNIGPDTFECSASLIRRGIVVTAAHCVSEYGGAFHDAFEFVPGYKYGWAPYGVWRGTRAAVLNSWHKGTDPCSDGGVVCTNDVGVIRLAAQNGEYAGQRTGYYSYGVNGFGFAAGTTHVTQLGYPVCLDNGNRMERNDSQGYVHWPSSGNTIIGSLMCGGSSGGPWLANFGRQPNLTGTSAGSQSGPNVVIGVTSWGYVGGAPKQQGASRFTDANIGRLAGTLCGGSPSPC